jgi:SAM-dependent methyltransferase
MIERNENSKVVLEIGVGGHPFPVNPTMLDSHDGRQLNRSFRNGSMYVGIDSLRDPNRYWDSVMAFFQGADLPESSPDEDKRLIIGNLAEVQKMYGELKPDENINFMMADAHNLPFAPNSVDEVFFSNVFGSQLGEDSLEKILSSVSRVIKSDGKVVIRETGTPWWSWPEKLPDFLKENGFEVEEFANYGSPRYQEFLDTYGATFEDVDKESNILIEDMYYCVAKKAA